MKNIFKTGIKTVLLLCLVVFVTGCDLEPRPKFEFDNGVVPLYTFGAMTPYEWLSTNPKGEFTIMKQAIDLTGLQELYNGKGSKKTYFLLKDIAWTKSAGIFLVELNKTPNLIDPLTGVANTKVDINKLRNLLRYHVLDAYVDQGPQLYTAGKNYIFTTYYTTGAANKFSVSRGKTFTLGTNGESTFPVGKKGGNVKLHNYIFSDGNSVAHLMEDYSRYDLNYFNSLP